MTRHLRTQHRHLHQAHHFTLILAILIPPTFARIAVAAVPPAFQGTFTSASLCSPRGIGLSPSGDVFVGSDCLNPHMQRFTAAGALLGTWPFPSGYEGSPNGVAVDGSGSVFVTDYDGARVHKFTSSGALVTTWGSTGVAPGQFSQPVDIAVDVSGNVYVVELNGKRVQKFTNGGSYLATIGSAGSGPGQFQSPLGLAIDATGRIYVADADRLRILRFLANGTFDMEFAVPVAPTDVAVGPDGNIYVIHFDPSPVRQYSPGGVLLQGFGPPGGLAGPYRITISPAGAIFITEQYNTRVTKFQIDLTTTTARTTFGRLKALYR